MYTNGVAAIVTNPALSPICPSSVSANPILFTWLFLPITSVQYHPYSFAVSPSSAGCPLYITVPNEFGIVAYTYPLYVHISHIGLVTKFLTAGSDAYCLKSL